MTFFLPLVLTVITDFSVLIMRNPCTSKNAFTLISADEIVHHESTDEKSPLKIVHKSKIMVRLTTRNFEKCGNNNLLVNNSTFL